MVVRTREHAPTIKIYTSYYDVSDRLRTYTYRDWQSFTDTKFDFFADYFSTSVPKSRLTSITEFKKSSEKLAYKQIALYLRKLLVDQERTLWGPIVVSHIEEIPVKEIVGEVYEAAVTAPPIDVIYQNQELVEALLGNRGRVVLEKVIKLLQDSVRRDNWPLTKVVVHHVKDLEVEDWQYTLVVLFFNCDLDTAERYLHDFYNKLDVLTAKFNDQEQDILERLLYFDARTNISQD